MIEVCGWDTARYLIFSDNVFGSFIYFSHIPAIIAALFFGLWVFSKKKDLLSGLLLFITVTFSIWAFFDLIVWATELSHYTMFFWSVLNMLEVLVYAAAAYFIMVSIEQRDISFRKKLVMMMLTLPSIVFMPSSLNLMGYDFSNCNRDAVEGALTYYNYIIEIFFVFWILVYSVKNYIKAKVSDKKLSIFYVTAGTAAFLLAFSSGNIAGTFTDDWIIGQIGIIGLPIFVGFLAYSIIKFKTFNIKLLSTQALLVALGVMLGSLLFIRTLENVQAIVAISLIMFLLIAINLVRSVKRVDTQAEQLKKQTVDLKKANDRLVELDRQKSEFVSFATHQLRSPLTAMKGYSSLILDGDYGQVNAEVKEAVSRIAESTRTLVAVVDSYLNISRIELGTMKYELVPIDLSSLVKDVVAELRPTIESSGLEYITNIAPDIRVNADKDKLKQVLGNLIDNSMKYTPKGSVQVTLESISSEGKNKILFSVKDTGIGMHPDVIPKLFEKFVRANNANKANIHGTGLGLFVAKEIVKGHNGRIWAESDGEGKGSRFFVEIPAA